MGRRALEADKALLQAELLEIGLWARGGGQIFGGLFEGRDAAGRGGTTTRFTDHLNPRFAPLRGAEPADRAGARPMVRWKLPTSGKASLDKRDDDTQAREAMLFYYTTTRTRALRSPRPPPPRSPALTQKGSGAPGAMGAPLGPDSPPRKGRAWKPCGCRMSETLSSGFPILGDIF